MRSNKQYIYLSNDGSYKKVYSPDNPPPVTQYEHRVKVVCTGHGTEVGEKLSCVVIIRLSNDTAITTFKGLYDALVSVGANVSSNVKALAIGSFMINNVAYHLYAADYNASTSPQEITFWPTDGTNAMSINRNIIASFTDTILPI